MTKESDEALPQSPLCASPEKRPFDLSFSLLRLNWALIAAPLTSAASAHA